MASQTRILPTNRRLPTPSTHTLLSLLILTDPATKTTAKMATPSSTTDEKRPLEQITFRFCSECSNMLYPKEDPDSRQLLYVCRTCQYTEEAATSCVFRSVMNSASGETAGVTQDVTDDPTVSGDVCLLCGCFLDADTAEDAGSDGVGKAVALLEEWDEPDDWEPESGESAPGAEGEGPAQ